MRKNQLSALKTTPTRLTFGIRRKKISFVSRAKRILTREQIATRSCVKILLSALDTKYTILYSESVIDYYSTEFPIKSTTK